MSRSPFCAIPVALAGAVLLLTSAAPASVIRITVASRTPAFKGQSFGTTGAYELVRGTAIGEIDPSDRRKQYAVLTPDGDRTLRAARRTHNQVLQRTLFKVLSPTERRMLQRVWKRLAAAGSAPV